MKADFRSSLTWEFVWGAIDEIAARNAGEKMRWNGLSILVRDSGLYAGALSKSRRVAADGTRLWPSMKTISKILSTTNISLAEFAEIRCKPYVPAARIGHKVKATAGDKSSPTAASPSRWKDSRIDQSRKIGS